MPKVPHEVQVAATARQSYDPGVSDLGDVLELMHTARQRPLAVRATLRHWSDQQVFREAMDRWHAGFQKGSVSLLVVQDARGEPARFSEEVFRVWHRRPGPLWRVEQETRGKTSVTILNGRRWWSNSFEDRYWTNLQPDGGIARNVGGEVPSPVLDVIFCPSIVPAVTLLQTVGTVSHLGREAVSLHGRLEISERGGGYMFSLGAPYADAVELLVDRSTGMLLQISLSLDGQEFSRWEVEEADFDARLNDGLFVGPADAQLPPMPDVDQLPDRLRERARRSFQRGARQE
jgi:hypothetical protein